MSQGRELTFRSNAQQMSNNHNNYIGKEMILTEEDDGHSVARTATFTVGEGSNNLDSNQSYYNNNVSNVQQRRGQLRSMNAKSYSQDYPSSGQYAQPLLPNVVQKVLAPASAQRLVTSGSMTELSSSKRDVSSSERVQPVNRCQSDSPTPVESRSRGRAVEDASDDIVEVNEDEDAKSIGDAGSLVTLSDVGVDTEKGRSASSSSSNTADSASVTSLNGKVKKNKLGSLFTLRKRTPKKAIIQ
jgi:hypothetical protein